MANAKKGKTEEGVVKASEGQLSASSKSEGAADASAFVWVGRVWIVLAGIALGASLSYLLGGTNFFAKELSRMGSVSVTPGLLSGVVFGVLVVLGLMRLFRGRLDWALPNQGRGVRLVSYVSIMVLMVFGSWQLHGLPGLESSWSKVLGSVGPFFGEIFEFKPILFPSAALVLVSGLVCHFLLGRQSWRSFMIETESELKKVSWPERPEWVGSSIVVLVVVTSMALFLYLCDIGLSRLMNALNAGV